MADDDDDLWAEVRAAVPCQPVRAILPADTRSQSETCGPANDVDPLMAGDRFIDDHACLFYRAGPCASLPLQRLQQLSAGPVHRIASAEVNHLRHADSITGYNGESVVAAARC